MMLRVHLSAALFLPLSLIGAVASAQEAPPPGAAPAPSPPGGWVEPAPAPSERLPPLIPASPEAAPVQPAGAAVLRPGPASRPAANVDTGGLPRPPGTPSTRVFMGSNVGWVGGRFEHPKLYGTGFSGLNIGAHAGVSITRTLAVGLDFNAYRTGLEYVGDGKYGFKGADNPHFVNGVRVAAGCQTCDKPQSGAGFTKEGPLNVLTVGPRVQFAPDPARGFFAAATAGVTFLEAPISNRTGAALGARGGYRLAISEQVGVALEVGGTAHRLGGATSAFGFGGLQLQMRI